MKIVSLIAFIGILASVSVYGDPIDVYASSFPSSYPTIETVNLATGNVTPMGTINWGGIINDIAVSPINGNIYGVSGSNLLQISPNGNVTTIAATGMNGGTESLAFNNKGNLYLATQSSLYQFNFSTGTAGSAVYIGDYNQPGLSGTGQNIRYNGNTLYVTDTQNDGNTKLYTVSTNNGLATLVGVVTNQQSLALGNYGGQLLGSSVPTINNGSGSVDILNFGTQVTTTDYHGEEVVNYSVLPITFPENVNFSQAGSGLVALGSVAAVPEPSLIVMLGLGLVGIVVCRRKLA